MCELYGVPCWNDCCCPQPCFVCVPGPRGPRGFTGVQGPQGPQGQPGPAGASSAGLAAYGGLYNSSTQLLAFTAVNTYVRLQLNTLMPMKNVAAGTNQLTIQNEGDYEINYNLLVNTNRAVDVAAVVRNNGTPITQTRAVQTLAIDNTTTLAYDGRLNCSTIVHLTAGSVLDLAMTVLNTLPPGLSPQADTEAVINPAKDRQTNALKSFFIQ